MMHSGPRNECRAGHGRTLAMNQSNELRYTESWAGLLHEITQVASSAQRDKAAAGSSL